MVNAVTCAFFDIRVSCGAGTGPFVLGDDRLIAVITVTREQLDYFAWRVVGHQEIDVPRAKWPNQGLPAGSKIGLKVLDAAIAEDLLNAYNGLAPWDDWHDPLYLEKLLAYPARKPANGIYLKSKEGA